MFRSSFKESGIKLDEKEIPEETRSCPCEPVGMLVEEEDAMKAITGEACDPAGSLFKEDAMNEYRDEDATESST